MPTYILTIPSVTGSSAVNDVRNVVVAAFTPDDARARAKSLFSNDSDGLWDVSATQIPLDASNLLGFRMRIIVSDPATGDVVVDLTGTAAGVQMDGFAAAAVILLNNTTIINAASYNVTSDVLTVAGVADNLGDHNLVVEIFPPLVSSEQNVAVPSFVTTIVDEGIAGAVLTAQLAGGAVTFPGVPVAIS